MTLSIGITLAAIVALLAVSALFSGSETALTAASRARMHQLSKRGDARAKRVNRLLQAKDNLIGALLLGNNLVNILASALTTSLFLDIFGDAGVAYATLIMTALVLIFSEVLPKTYALTYTDRTALKVSGVISLIVKIFSPVTIVVQMIVRSLMRIGGVRIDENTEMLSPHEEIRGTIDLHHREGGMFKHDKDMLGGVLDLGEMDVEDVMIHRTDVIAVNVEQSVDDAIAEVLTSQYSRTPLWSTEPDNFIGILHTRDLARELARVKGDTSGVDLQQIASIPWFVPNTTSLQDQLHAFLKQKSHFAVVVDEYGEVMGIVTLEDILEEIVGEIEDEHDPDVKGVRRQSDGTFIVDGSVPIRDLNRALDWHLPEVEATTIAGLVIHEAKMIPERGQAFTFHGFKFEIMEKQKNRLLSLRVARPGPQRKPVATLAGTPPV